jgi:hypothetical protein
MTKDNPTPQHQWNLEKMVQPQELFDSKDPMIQEDILRLICQYLQDQGYSIAASTVLDEGSVKAIEKLEQQQDIKRMKKALLGLQSSCRGRLARSRSTVLQAVHAKPESLFICCL